LKKIVFLLIVCTIPAFAFSEESLVDQPHWSLELKGGRFAPTLPDWAASYGRKDMPEYSISFAYKVRRMIELGVEGGAATARGRAIAKLHTEQTGQTVFAGAIRYEIYPINAFVLFRGVLSENQAVVPYLGGGFTHILYRQAVEGQGSVKGSANGYHARGGLQFLLDGLDQDAANSMYLDYGVLHTYLFIEAEYTSAKVKDISTDLGGTAYLAGILFEF
jgi:hypothetical protein